MYVCVYVCIYMCVCAGQRKQRLRVIPYREDIHRRSETGIRGRRALHEALRCEVTGAPSAGVKVEREIGRVVLCRGKRSGDVHRWYRECLTALRAPTAYPRNEGGLPRRIVSEEYPVPTRAQDVLALDVAVVDAQAVRLLKRYEELVGDPFLLNEGEEWSGAGRGVG